jgi:hypothetical protein
MVLAYSIFYKSYPTSWANFISFRPPVWHTTCLKFMKADLGLAELIAAIIIHLIIFMVVHFTVLIDWRLPLNELFHLTELLTVRLSQVRHFFLIYTIVLLDFKTVEKCLLSLNVLYRGPRFFSGVLWLSRFIGFSFVKYPWWWDFEGRLILFAALSHLK